MRWAIIDQLQHPPPEFGDVIRGHFRLRRDYLSKQVAAWLDDAAGDAGHRGRLAALKTQMEAELAKL